MLIVVRSIQNRAFLFSTARKRTRRTNEKAAPDAPLEKDVFKAYRSQVEKSSILREFRREVFRRSELSEEWESLKTKEKKEQRQLEDMLKGEEREQIVRNATHIESRLANRRNIFHENSSHSLLSDYANYTAYDKVYPVLEDRNLDENEFIEEQHMTENLYKFIDKLPDNYEEKVQLQKHMQSLAIVDRNMSLSDYGRRLQQQFNEAQELNAKRNEEYKVHLENKYLPEPARLQDIGEEPGESVHDYTGIEQTVDPYNGGTGLDATLSPEAHDTIYELYLQGWTVRDISKRFGIMPARTKFCVWTRAQLYHEVIPKLGVKFYLRALRYQQQYNAEQRFCDYGLDIEDLTNDGILAEINEWNGSMLDAQRKEDEYFGAMKRLEVEKKFNRYELVEVGYHDKENSKYRLKEWVIFRGKGSDEYFLKHDIFLGLSKAQRKFTKQYY